MNIQVLQNLLNVCLSQAIDDDCNETGQMTAALLDWPQVNSNFNAVILKMIRCHHQCELDYRSIFCLYSERHMHHIAIVTSGYTPGQTTSSTSD